MTKAFLYDSLCGIVYRCMFAGLDEYGHAQWVNITPGEEPRTLEDYLQDEDLGGTRFYLLSMEGETAQSLQVAKVLGKVMECPVDGLGADLVYTVRHMQEIGVKWDQKPLKIVVRVFENGENSRRKGKYSVWLEDGQSVCGNLADIDAFDSLGELFTWINTYFFVLEQTAKIPVIKKSLRISDELMKEAKKRDLADFDHISKERFHQN